MSPFHRSAVRSIPFVALLSVAALGGELALKSTPVVIPIGSEFIGVVAPFDGDGLLDTVTHYQSQFRTLEMRTGTPSGLASIAVQSVFETQPFAFQPTDVREATDIDGDGDVDLVGLAFFDNFDGRGSRSWVFSLLNDGSGAFRTRRFSELPGTGGAWFFALSDMDGDGVRDAVVGTHGGNQLAWLRNLGGGSFALDSQHALLERANDALARDFDGDGDLDLMLRGRDEVAAVTWVRLLRQTVVGFVADPKLPAQPDTSSAFAAADLDGDGDEDLVLAQQRAADPAGCTCLALFANDGTGAFTASGRVGTVDRDGALIHRVTAADLDGDGRTDLAYSEFYGPLIVLRAAGPLSFEPRVRFDIGPSVRGGWIKRADRWNGAVTFGAVGWEPGSAATLQPFVAAANTAPWLPATRQIEVVARSRYYAEQLSSDAEGHHVAFTFGQPAFGRLEWESDGMFTYYAPDRGGVVDSFQVIATDDRGASSTMTYQIEVTDAPGDGGGGPLDPWSLAFVTMLLAATKTAARRRAASRT